MTPEQREALRALIEENERLLGALREVEKGINADVAPAALARFHLLWRRADVATLAPLLAAQPQPVKLEWEDGGGEASADCGDDWTVDIQRDLIDTEQDHGGDRAWFVSINGHQPFQSLDAAKAECERIVAGIGGASNA